METQQASQCSVTNIQIGSTKEKYKPRRTSLTSKEAWTLIKSNLKKEGLPLYNMQKTFVSGDHIDHIDFGPGFVLKTIDQNKIKVIFEHSAMLLAHNQQ